MSAKAIFYHDYDYIEDDDGFRYIVGSMGSRRPSRFWPELTAATVGWRRFEDEEYGICETLRLPEGFAWIRLGNEEFSSDMREYTRRGLTDPHPTHPDVLDGTTAFRKSGYLAWYFIEKQETGERRILKL